MKLRVTRSKWIRFYSEITKKDGVTLNDDKKNSKYFLKKNRKMMHQQLLLGSTILKCYN